tara:strand:+ start:194 stop:574 length:381 start_codon:yes stop_codon:yes gene_type:complete
MVLSGLEKLICELDLPSGFDFYWFNPSTGVFRDLVGKFPRHLLEIWASQATGFSDLAFRKLIHLDAGQVLGDRLVQQTLKLLESRPPDSETTDAVIFRIGCQTISDAICRLERGTQGIHPVRQGGL